MADPNVATADDLDRELITGAHELTRDVAGQQIERDKLPVGVVGPGQTLVQFWHLDFPVKSGPNYSEPIVITLLQQMLSIQRLSPAAANTLALRIRDTLAKQFGNDGLVMATMLLARCRQAIAEPEGWPSLLDDAELLQAYAAYSRNTEGFKGAGSVFGAAVVAPGLADKHLAGNTNPPQWLRNAARALRGLEIRLQRQLPASLRVIQIPSFGFNKGKPFKRGGLELLQSYIAAVLAQGYLQNRTRANAYEAELRRRGLPVP